MVRYIGKVQIRKWLLPELKLIAKTHGFKVRSGVNVDVEQDAGSVLYTMFWQLASDDSLKFSSGGIRVKKVEEILRQTTEMEVYNNTITVFVHAPEFDKKTRIITCQQDVVELAGTFRQVFEEVYLPGFERFSQPERILEFWDSLQTDKERGRFFQDSNNISKILILARMCNDKNYDERVTIGIETYERRIKEGETFWVEELEIYKKVINYLAANEVQ
jgi:hypothetical protein